MLALTSFMSTVCRADLFGACYFVWGNGNPDCINKVTESFCERFVEDNDRMVKESEGNSAQGARLIIWVPGKECKR